MSENAVTVPFICPGCLATLSSATEGLVKCPQCKWAGDFYSFSPKVLAVESAPEALPEDATCLHHPRKKAIAVCSGTGDYVCSLCAIELNGQTYSANYLDGAGKKLAGKAFDRTLPRPDSQIMLYMVLCFVPYANFIFIPFAFLWIPHSVYLYFKLLKARKESVLLQRLVARWRIIAIPILLTIFTLAWIAGVVALVLWAMTKKVGA